MRLSFRFLDWLAPAFEPHVLASVWSADMFADFCLSDFVDTQSTKSRATLSSITLRLQISKLLKSYRVVLPIRYGLEVFQTVWSCELAF